MRRGEALDPDAAALFVGRVRPSDERAVTVSCAQGSDRGMPATDSGPGEGDIRRQLSRSSVTDGNGAQPRGVTNG